VRHRLGHLMTIRRSVTCAQDRQYGNELAQEPGRQHDGSAGRMRVPGLGQAGRLGQRAALRGPARSANRLLGRRITFYVYAVRGYTCEPLTTEVEMSTAEVKSRRAAGLKTPTNL